MMRDVVRSSFQHPLVVNQTQNQDDDKGVVEQQQQTEGKLQSEEVQQCHQVQVQQRYHQKQDQGLLSLWKRMVLIIVLYVCVHQHLVVKQNVIVMPSIQPPSSLTMTTMATNPTTEATSTTTTMMMKIISPFLQMKMITNPKATERTKEMTMVTMTTNLVALVIQDLKVSKKNNNSNSDDDDVGVGAYGGTALPDPDPDNPNMICPLKHCPLQVFDCLINYNCHHALQCNQDCLNRTNQVGCNLICSFQYGYHNYAYKQLLSCMSTNHCLPVLPMNGKCLAPNSTNGLVQNVTNLNQIQGKWWILKGLNCGSGGSNDNNDTIWTGGFDAFPCQYDNFLPKLPPSTTAQQPPLRPLSSTTSYSLLRGGGHSNGGGDEGSAAASSSPADYAAVDIISDNDDNDNSTTTTTIWYDQIGYCGGNVLNETTGNNCTTQYIQTIANVSIMPNEPGILHHEYIDAPLIPQIENWYILSYPHPNYMLYVYCGETPTGKYGGGSVVVRSKDITAVPKWIETIFAQVAFKNGFDYYHDMCTLNNTQCAN